MRPGIPRPAGRSVRRLRRHDRRRHRQPLAPYRDGRIDAIETAWSRAGGAPATGIKAFNNIYADHLRDYGRPPGTPERVALPVAGDDSNGKRWSCNGLTRSDFDAVDAGALDGS
jgi:hypothetical protein